jgi:hypothetical protein
MADQRHRLDLGKQYEDGREQLHHANEAMDRERRALRGIAVAALCARCAELGREVKEILAPDAEYYSGVSAVRAPRGDLQRQAVAAATVAASISGHQGEAYDAFEKAAGGVAREIMDRWHGDLNRPYRVAVC